MVGVGKCSSWCFPPLRVVLAGRHEGFAGMGLAEGTVLCSQPTPAPWPLGTAGTKLGLAAAPATSLLARRLGPGVMEAAVGFACVWSLLHMGAAVLGGGKGGPEDVSVPAVVPVPAQCRPGAEHTHTTVLLRLFRPLC